MSDSENDDEETDFYANMITCEDCEGNEFIPDDDELADDETELKNEEKKIRAYKTTCSATCISCGESVEYDNLPWVKMYANYCVCLVIATETVKGKNKLKQCKVDIGSNDDEEEPITVITNDKNVREGDRLVVAMIGAVVPAGGAEEEGENEMTIQKTNVGGVTSHGMFCDESMLRWGNTKNKAIRMPENIELGSRPTRLPPNTIK